MSISLSQTPLRFPLNPLSSRDGASPSRTDLPAIRLRRVGPRTTEEFIKVAETRQERQAAFRLVHDIYVRSGLIEPQPSGMRVTRHHLADGTDVLIAKRGGRVSFTLTLVRDADQGLPLDSLFAREVRSMRAEGLRLAEVSCLANADRGGDRKRQFERFVGMISLALQAARRRGVDRLLLAVHPRHARVYQRMFGCAACSQVKEYAAVRGNPAILCMHDFARTDETRYPLYEKIYGPRYAPWQLDGARMAEAERRFFAGSVAADGGDFIPMAA